MHEPLHSVPPALQQATANPHLHWRLLVTPRPVLVSLSWSHCSFLLDPGMHKVLFVPSKSLFDSTHGHHHMVNPEIKLIIFFSAKNGEPLYNQQKQDRELTASDHELLIAKFRLKLKKVGKTTRPFRYNLNQIPYDYTVEVTNRFKGLDLIDSLQNYGQRFVTLHRRQ